ncbi:MAG: methanogenesis marker protein 11 [Methanoculleaceae archaeon]
MERISDPYTITYPWIAAVADERGERVELIECFDCIGGAMWVKKHYRKSPLVESVRTVGSTNRYILRTGSTSLPLAGPVFAAGIAGVAAGTDDITITYRGLGGGGVGAAVCRATARGVIGAIADPCGGGQEAGSTIRLPRRERVLIGVDDTDTAEKGATWTLCHNIAGSVADEDSYYLSHTIVQLYPVRFRTKNCVSIVCEFATTDPERLIDRFARLLEGYTLSSETGMAVFRGFDPSPLRRFGERVKRGEISADELDAIDDPRFSIRMDGRGVVGATAAIPFATRFDRALELSV